ncbi:MAG TPA: sigma-70 family RNA polymerase sigma factor [Thermomicrobiales bacterium]|nr:sigma-70 family RNA polymerase sigma factor [Thermomicrobiales bacterium]
MPSLLRTRPPTTGAAPFAGEGDGLNDSTLLALAKQDRQAFAALYRRYVDAVYRYCERCLGDREAAEDAVSLTFTKALAALPRCRDDAFRPWLFTIAHNVIVDMVRKRPPAWPLAAADRLADQAPDRSPEAWALAADDARTIRALLAQLPPDQRELLELRLAGLTDAEIARVLGRSHGAVRTSQCRALARLRALVGAAIEEATDERR